MATFANLTDASRSRGGHRTLAPLPSTSTVVGDTAFQRHDGGHNTAERVARWLSQQRTLETEGFVMLDAEEQPGYRPASRQPILIDVDNPSGDGWELGEAIVIDGPVRGRYLAGQSRDLKRKVSYHGHRDEDPGVPEPSGGALRQDIKAMLAGTCSVGLPVRKRPKLPAPLQVKPGSHPAINRSLNLGVPGLPGSNRVTITSSHPGLSLVSNPFFDTVASPVSSPGTGPVPSLASTPTLSPPPILSLPPASSVAATPDLAATPGLAALPTSPVLPAASATGRSKNRRRGAQKRRPAQAADHAPVLTPRLESVPEGILELADVLPCEDIDIIEPIEPEGKCWFFVISAEIRDHIYRHLLVSQKPVHVKKLWTEQARSNARRSPRKRGAAPEKLFETEADTLIDTRILRVCRQTAFEGTRILYSENKFLYILRDPPRDQLPSYSRRFGAASGSGSRRNNRAIVPLSLPPSPSNISGRIINFAKYCHLFRHMAIELEPNRTEKEYEHLMVNALEALTVSAVDGSSSSSSTGPDHGDDHLKTSRISLDTLTITITPVLQPRTRNRRETSVADFFSQRSRALEALQRINSRSIRVNVHVDQPRSEDDDSDDGNDLVHLSDDGADIDNSNLVRRRDGNKRHLETTLDMRFCSRFMDQTRATHIRNPFHNELFPDEENVPSLIKVYPDELWQSDPHILAKRSMLGQKAEAALADLRNRITAACTDPDKVVREGLWEDHEVAEQRRRVLRAKHQNKFDCDALLLTKRSRKATNKKKKKAAKGKGKEVTPDSDDDDDSDENEGDGDGSTNATDSEGDGGNENGDDGDGESSDEEGSEPCFSPTKSLMLSFSRLGCGTLRANRA